MIFESVLFFFVLLVWWYSENKRKYKGFPPGPLRFPIVGNLPQIMTKSSDPAVAFAELANTYGDIMFLNMGKLDAVVFSSHNSILKLFQHEKAATRGGFKIPVIKERILEQNLGIIWGNDDAWLNLRRFTVRTLRDFGFGKTQSMDFVINEEWEKFKVKIDGLVDASPSGVLHFDTFFDLAVINILWRLVTGVNYAMDDASVSRLLRISNDQAMSSSFSFDISIAFPRLREWFPWMFGQKENLKRVGELNKFARDTIDEHRAAGNYKTDPKGFVDIFLGKIDEHKDHPHFNDTQLVLTILDLFQAGAETTGKTLSFGILYMILNPQIQEKVYNEIASVVPPNEPMTMGQKFTLPFTYATLLEVLRYSTVVPFPPLRESPDSFYFEGHLIRKGTALMPNFYATHFDKEVWGDPHTFRPERFLTANGTQVDSKMENLIIPFGGGKRICVGKGLAEANLFLFFTSMLKTYKFEKVVNTPDPSITPIIGMTYSNEPYDAKITKRT